VNLLEQELACDANDKKYFIVIATITHRRRENIFHEP